MTTWSAPFHGVSHLEGLRPGFQVTVCDYDVMAECQVFTPGNGFSANVSKHPTAQQAMAAGVQAADSLNAWADGVRRIDCALPELDLANVPASPVLSEPPHCEGHAFLLGARR